ncbi:uncharacterized protein LOC133185242 [Saccostrea echinata]|uniref:uncharacterized protein LOC133185242 n=1 Tax=Saccostrea echinata TaxID=191078 RepID=UPI002A81A7AB|nr:uncharacterized protein LOC133185242 [Saccostrea echinata]
MTDTTKITARNTSVTAENATTIDLVTTTTEKTTLLQTTMEMAPPVNSSESGGSDVGMVVGVVIGSLVFVIFALLTALFLRGRYLKKKNKPPPNPLPNPEDIDKIALEASKKSKKKKKKERHNYEKDPTSTVSIEPEAPSCPAFMAPDPPSTSSVDYENAPSKRKQLKSETELAPPPSHNTKEPGYVNTPRKGTTTQKVELTEDFYVAPKANTTKLYSTGEGSEYYICDEGKNTPNSKVWKSPPRNPLEDSVTSTCSAIDYVNMFGKNKYLELVPESKPVEEPQDFYEPVDS